MAVARDLDVVIFGATGDTGVVGSACLYFHGKKFGIRSWAPAGRNLQKLKKELLDRLVSQAPGEEGLAPADPIVADSSDYESLKKMCSRAKCVLACAGPYMLYGEGVVQACVEMGTNYVDITGEVPWVVKMKRKYGEEAEKKGISLVSMAGYDSVPPDVMTYLGAKALEKEGEHLKRFEAFIGGKGPAPVPTGSLNTLVEMVDNAKRSALKTASFGLLGKRSEPREARQEVAHPAGAAAAQGTYYPESEARAQHQNLIWSLCPGYSRLAGRFAFPHFMAPININVVHHTAAKEGYGGLEYRERMALPSGPLSLFGLIPSSIATGIAVLIGCLAALPYFTTGMKMLVSRSNTQTQALVKSSALNGFSVAGKVVARGFGEAHSGQAKVTVSLEGAGDPGLAFTMLSACVTAAEMAKRFETSEAPKAGFVSAVVALGGESFVEQLRAAGMKFEVQVQKSRL